MRARHVLVLLGTLLLLAFAYSPLAQAGLLASDYAALLGADGGPPGASPGAPTLARLSLELSHGLWGVPAVAGTGGFGGGALFRLENLFLHVVAAVGLGLFARRLLLPWSGSEQAVAAGASAALFFALHPLATPAVAAVSSRGDLCGMAFGVWSAAAFLRGRQDRRYALTATALLLCVLAGASSDLALGLPLVLAVSELVSAHRYRPLRVRLRTSLTTLVVFGAGASVDLVLRLVEHGSAALPPGLRTLREVGSRDDALTQVVVAIEKLGLLVLPANPLALGTAGTVLAGAVFLLAMQPALMAAKNAPRLWGWLLCGWLLSLAASEVLHAHVRVTAGDFSVASALLSSVAVMSVGMGLGATALSGLRRPIVAWAVALGLASLSHGNGRPWKQAAMLAATLRQDLVAARDRYGEGRILVLDPPAPYRGVDPIGGGLAWLLDPELDDPRRRGAGPPDVRGVSIPAFLAFVREPEFARLASQEPIVVTPEGAFTEQGRRALKLRAPRPSDPVLPWQASLKSPQLGLEPLETAALRVTVAASADVESLRRVSWLTSEIRLPDLPRTHEGVWLPVGAERIGVFDLGDSLAWRLGGRVRSLLFEEGTQPIDRGEILAELPPLGELEPRVDGNDWVFDRPQSRLVDAGGERGRFVLGLLDVDELVHEELHARSGAQSADRELRFRRAEAWARSHEPLAWSLDYRIDELSVARARGRRP